MIAESAIAQTGPVACFAAGTHILTTRGELPVEALQIGDRAIVLDGSDAPVIWIGVRRLPALARHPRPRTVQPVRVSAGALGENSPADDLVLSPDHAVYLDGHLVPVRCLVDGIAVVQLERPSVTYYHVELPSHAILYAELAPVESFLDIGNRDAFDNGGGPIALHPEFAHARRAERSCAPLLEAGPALRAMRARITARARRRALVSQASPIPGAGDDRG